MSNKKIGNTALVRLARAAGVKQLGNLKLHNDEINYTIEAIIKDILIKTMYVARFSDRQTIQLKDVRFVLEEVFNMKMTVGSKVYKLCKDMTRTTKKPQKKGEKAKKVISFSDTLSECFLISPGTFDSFVRAVATDSDVDFIINEVRFSKDALTLMHFFVESEIVSYFKKARFTIMNNGRKTLLAKDLMLIKTLKTL